MVDITEPTMTQVEQMWGTLSSLVFVPYTEADYNRLVAFLHELIKASDGDESHPIDLLMDVVGVLILDYEREHYPELDEEE